GRSALFRRPSDVPRSKHRPIVSANEASTTARKKPGFVFESFDSASNPSRSRAFQRLSVARIEYQGDLVMLVSSLVVAVWAVSAGEQPDLSRLPANTWVEIPYATEQPERPDEKGSFARQGWNKIVYDPVGKRVLFYDRWVDKRHGGQTIYGNCLFALDPASNTLTPVKIDNWTKMEPKGGGYRTLPLPENEKEPTPCPRHVYLAFDYVPELKAIFICNGANQTVLDKDGKFVGHDMADGAWRLDLKTNKWTQLAAKPYPGNYLDDSMAYCPDTK